MIYPPQNELRIIYHLKIQHSSTFLHSFLLFFSFLARKRQHHFLAAASLTSPDAFPGITSCAAASLHEMFFPALRPGMYFPALRPPMIFGALRPVFYKASLPAQQHHFMKCFAQPCVH